MGMIGLNLATAHGKAGYEDLNPGIYYRADNGLTAGVYRNSQGHTSVIGGWTWETPNKQFALTVGAVTGYEAAKVMPAVIPSVRFGDPKGIALRMSLLPKPPVHSSTWGLHFSLEKEF